MQPLTREVKLAVGDQWKKSLINHNILFSVSTHYIQMMWRVGVEMLELFKSTFDGAGLSEVKDLITLDDEVI